MHKLIQDNDFSWEFYSVIGQDRACNKDVFALILREKITLIIAFDISTSSPAQPEMAVFFSKILSNTVDSLTEYSDEIIHFCIQLAFEKTKKQYQIGKASILIFGKLEQSFFCFHAGDVRLGIYNGNTPIHWVTNVHTGANPLGGFFNIQMLKDEKRKIVTRNFNLQRDLILDFLDEIELFEGNIVIATDGFWAECSHEQQQLILAGHSFLIKDDLTLFMFTWNKNNKLSNNINIDNLILF
ncbi:MULTISPECIES: hypothetical protein [Providencia]|uniref:hypothetical protein n=1 Tax=Providencia TaxID=586 RepID=UPI0012B558BE|nr:MULTISPECIES: hypothetical protein [Providencia]MTC56634.1 hypothetical protein [Providencia rustigianii]